MFVEAKNFEPLAGATVFLAVTPVSASVSFNLISTTGGPPGGVSLRTRKRAVRVHNAGPSMIFFDLGTAGITATVPIAGTPGSTAIPPGTIEIYGAEGVTHIAAIAGAGGGATLYITPGEGS